MMLRNLFSALLITASATAMAAPFAAGNIAVTRVGNGTALTNAGTASFVDEYTPAGTFVQTITLPTTGSSALTVSGTATSEAALSRSVDGRYLVVAGYRADAGTASVASTGVPAVPRVAGRIDWNGNVDTTTEIVDAFSGNNVRSAFTNDGTNFWFVGGNSGVRHQVFGSNAASTSISTTFTNMRVLGSFNSQLYVSSSSSTLRLGTVGTGFPTTASQTITNLPASFPTSTISPYGFFFSDADTVWIADDRATGSGGGLLKYTATGGVWSATGTQFNSGLPDTTGLRGLTGFVNGANITLYGVNGSATPNSLLAFTSTDGGATGSWSVIATAPSLNLFRAVALAPVNASSIADWQNIAY